MKDNLTQLDTFMEGLHKQGSRALLTCPGWCGLVQYANLIAVHRRSHATLPRSDRRVGQCSRRPGAPGRCVGPCIVAARYCWLEHGGSVVCCCSLAIACVPQTQDCASCSMRWHSRHSCGIASQPFVHFFTCCCSALPFCSLRFTASVRHQLHRDRRGACGRLRGGGDGGDDADARAPHSLHRRQSCP